MFKKQILSILGLIQKQSFRSASDLQAKKIMEIAKILKLKLRTKLLNQCLQGGTIASKNNVIYIY